jgi:uncharacterized iron-regulated membrane protein
MTLRKLLFWPHLLAGVVAGGVLLFLCATGTLLMFERQLIAWSDSQHRSVMPAADASRASIAIVVGRVTAEGGTTPTSVTVAADPSAPVTVVANGRTMYVDAYSGAVLGEASTGVRTVMRELRSWHRWLDVDGDGRQSARAVTGWATVLFTVLAVSGVYLWIPRSRAQVRAVLTFRGGLRGKARDFNWHNVIGIWSCVPLIIVALSAWPMSFPWANAAVYRAMGEPVPAGRGGGEAGPRGGARADQGRDGMRGQRSREPRSGARPGEQGGTNQAGSFDSRILDTLLARARSREPDWKTITVRWPASASAPVQLAIDRSDGGRPQARSTLSFTAAGDLVTYETFGSQTAGRRLRSVLRFAHTGEVIGLPGQLIAGLASAGGMVLVWTGLSLALRRAAGWLRRRRRVTTVAPAATVDSAA